MIFTICRRRQAFALGEFMKAFFARRDAAFSAAPDPWGLPVPLPPPAALFGATSSLGTTPPIPPAWFLPPLTASAQLKAQAESPMMTSRTGRRAALRLGRKVEAGDALDRHIAILDGESVARAANRVDQLDRLRIIDLPSQVPYVYRSR
jgi:hypothetical protein